MKKVLILFIVFALFFASCVSQQPKVDYAYPQTGNINNAPSIPMKDYQTLGIIFVESTEIVDSSGNHTGSKITYAMLMREAAKLGADDIINLRIDVQETHELVAVNTYGGVTSQTTYKYTATALAIKYTTVITNHGVIESHSRTSNIAVSPTGPSKLGRLRKMYIGGFLGGGWCELQEEKRNNFLTWIEYSTIPLALTGVVFDFIPIRVNVAGSTMLRLGAEAILGLSIELEEGGIFPLVPIMAKLGADFGGAGVTLNSGYAVLMGFVWGGEIDVNIGSGKLFLKYMSVPSINIGMTGVRHASANTIVAGYKMGLGY